MKYPTEEELMLLIETLEQEELYAPKHLKTDILERMERQERAMQRADRKRQKNAQSTPLLFYSAKIIVGMAAAIVLVFTIPLGNGSGFSQAAYPPSIWESVEEEPWQTPKNEEFKLRKVRETVRGLWERFTDKGIPEMKLMDLEREETK